MHNYSIRFTYVLYCIRFIWQALATLICLVVGYPFAYLITTLPKKMRDVFFIPDHFAILDQFIDPRLRTENDFRV